MEVVLADPFLEGTVDLDEVRKITAWDMLLNEDGDWLLRLPLTASVSPGESSLGHVFSILNQVRVTQ